MTDPLSQLTPLRPGGLSQRVADGAGPASGDDFSALLRRQLEQVGQMQSDADRSVEDLLTGRTQNISEVFTAARKAQVAFSLLMEIRNKLSDAYNELKQLRV